MRKFKRGIISAAVFFTFTLMVSANSGPVFWQGYPASEVMAIEENSPISVEGERLVFDFSDREDYDYTISGKVTANYEMVNPTKEQHMVQMAFPFVGKLRDFSPEDIKITADGNTVPYDIYLGAVADSHGNPSEEAKAVSYDFEDIVKGITDEAYRSVNFKENEQGKLYTFEVGPTTDERINFAVDFVFDHERSKVLTNGFNRYERNGQKTRIAAWCYEPEALEIYVLGDDIDFDIKAYTDGKLSEQTDLFYCRTSTRQVELKPYLMSYIEKNRRAEKENAVSELQLYNLYAASLDKYLTLNDGFSSEHDLMAQEDYERVFTLVYTVLFPPESKKEVSVRYRASATMDMRETAKPLYSFDYILNPAKNWKDFKNLYIEIIPPEKAPYIVKSSIGLTRGSDNTYTAALAELPKEDLSFTLYEDEKITLRDVIEGKMRNKFGYFYPLVMAAAALIFGVVTVKLVKRRKNR